MVKIKYMEDIMFETLTIDVTNVKKILKCCPYYDDIINSDIMYNDDLSIAVSYTHLTLPTKA